MDVTRIIELPSKTYIEEGDYVAIDNQQDGTQKVQFTNLFDSSLSQSNKIAPANIVGQQFTNTNTEINALRAAVGSPLKASTVAQMTDTNKIYVYTGSESGYTAGNWYYYNGTAWVSGGVYNSVAIETDKTLTVSDMAADAKVTGDEINDLKSALSAEIDTASGMFNYPVQLIRNKYVDKNDGLYKSESNWSATEYIRIPHNKVLELDISSAIEWCALYDASKQYISGRTLSKGVMRFPDNAVYVAMSGRTSNMETLTIKSCVVDQLSTNANIRLDKINGENLFDKASVSIGKAVDWNGEHDSTGWDTSDYISINNTSDYTLGWIDPETHSKTKHTNETFELYIYDELKNLFSIVTSAVLDKYNFDYGSYIRIGGYHAQMNSNMVFCESDFFEYVLTYPKPGDEIIYTVYQELYGTNLFNIDALTNDKYIKANGEIADYNGWSYTDYIPVNRKTRYTYLWIDDAGSKSFSDDGLNFWCACYDENKVYKRTIYLGNGQGTAFVNYQFDSDIHYIRLSGSTAKLSSDACLGSHQYAIKIERYTPFGEIVYFPEIKAPEIETRMSNDDSIIRSICRMGDAYGQPESASACKAAYFAGFNIIRVNLQFTSDGVPVLWHDPFLNQYYHNVYDSNGTLVPFTDADKTQISATSLSTLNQYKYGSASYEAGIPLAESIIAIARKLGMEVYFECKMQFSDANVNTIIALINKYAMMNRVSFAAEGYAQASQIANLAPAVRIGMMDNAYSSTVLEEYTALKTNKNRVFWWGWTSMSITDTMIAELSNIGLEYECGSIETNAQLTEYLERQNAWFCRGIEIQGSAVNPQISKNIIINA
jgi:glycerophosphoryl diester phosphodiesterase